MTDVSRIDAPPNRLLDARDIFRVDGAAGGWLVAEGSVDLFLLEQAPGQIAAARVHLMRCQTGGAVFGYADGPALLAVPNAAKLEPAAPAGAGEWVEALSAILPPDAEVAMWDGSAADAERFGRAAVAAKQDHLRRQRDLALEAQPNRSAAREHRLQAALRDLAAAASPEVDAGVSGLHEEPLVAACELMTAGSNLTIRLPAGGVDALYRAADPIAAIAACSGFQLRQVKLSGRWWRKDLGRLLAFRETDGAPVVLVPASPRGYRLIDPGDGSAVLMDASEAQHLGPKAFVFTDRMVPGNAGLGGLLRFGLAGSSRDLAQAAVMALLVGLAGLVTPKVTEVLTARVIPHAERSQLVVMVASLVMAALGVAAFSLVQAIAVTRIEGRMDARLPPALWTRLLSLPPAFFRGQSSGDLAARSRALDAVRQLLSAGAARSVVATSTAVAGLAMMMYYNWRLALLVAAAGAVFGIGASLAVRSLIGRSRRYFAGLREMQGLVLQLLPAVAKLRVTGSEDRAFKLWATRFARLRDLAWKRQILINGVAKALANLVFLLPAVILAAVGVQADVLWAVFETPMTWNQIHGLSVRDTFLAPDFIGFHVAYGQFLAALTALTAMALPLADAVAAFDQVAPILDAEPEDARDAKEVERVDGAFEIREVHFRYQPGSPPVLRGVSLTIPPGRFTAIVGPSGAGKSSLVRLLLGFDTPEFGSIFLDGEDLAQLDRRSLRRQIGVVLQNGKLLPGSLYDNIVGGAGLGLDAAWEAARLAGLAADIEAMPMGMQTVVSEGGSTLSGGQRQRLMIARAIVRRPRILIFDEATSALDNTTQDIVSQSLAGLDCTRIAIAHRLSTVVNADLIHVMEDGRVVETGTYAQLLARDGLFARLARRQLC